MESKFQFTRPLWSDTLVGCDSSATGSAAVVQQVSLFYICIFEGLAVTGLFHGLVGGEIGKFVLHDEVGRPVGAVGSGDG
jgi:hypothetical protein